MPKKASGEKSNPVLGAFNACLPNCERAIALAETGQKRDLGMLEKISLRYNRRLCPFCACAETKVEVEISKMEAARQSRAR